MSRLSQYLDVQQILDQALTSGGGEYALATHGAAVHWRHRAYTFRKRFFEATGQTKYDALSLKRVAPESSTVVIQVVRPAGTFIPAQGSAPAPHTDDSLEFIAAAVAAKIDGGIL